MLETGSISFATAFVAGVISFLSPCVLPLVPGYLSYVAGTSLESLRDRQTSRLRALGYAACFVLGFSLVFIAFGASATALGGLLLSWRYELGIARRHRRPAVRPASGRPAADPPARARGALPGRDQGRPGRRRLPARPRLRLRLDALHRPGAGRDPDHERLLGRPRHRHRAARGLFPGPGPAVPAGRPVHRRAARAAAAALARTGRQLQRVAGVLLAVVGVLMITGQLEVMAYWLLETFPALGRIG